MGAESVHTRDRDNQPINFDTACLSCCGFWRHADCTNWRSCTSQSNFKASRQPINLHTCPQEAISRQPPTLTQRNWSACAPWQWGLHCVDEPSALLMANQRCRDDRPLSLREPGGLIHIHDQQETDRAPAQSAIPSIMGFCSLRAFAFASKGRVEAQDLLGLFPTRNAFEDSANRICCAAARQTAVCWM